MVFYDVDQNSQYKSDYNIINDMEHSWRHIDTDQIGMQMALGYRIISSLKAEVNFSYNVSHTDDDTYYGEETSRMLAMRCIVKRALPNSALEIGDQNAAAATSVAGGELKLSNTKTRVIVFAEHSLITNR